MDVELLRNLMKNMPDAIYFKDRDSRFIQISNSLAQLYGLPDPQDAIGKTDHDFFPAEQADAMSHDERHIIESGDPIIGKLEHINVREGRRRWFSTTKLPLRNQRGDTIGVLGISRDITDQQEAEQALQEAYHQMEVDLDMARELQQAFLPRSYPTFSARAGTGEHTLRFEHVYLPSGHVGGDFFSVAPESSSVAWIFICDVMGHGVRSALITATIKGLLSELVFQGLDPGHVLRSVNSSLHAMVSQTPSVVFTSAFCGRLDVTDGHLIYASAGHPKPILLSPGSGDVALMGAEGAMGPALALFADAEYPLSQDQLEPGARLLLYTDGLFEEVGPDGNTFGQDRLMAEVRAAAHAPSTDLLNGLVTRLHAFTAGNPFEDDICILCVERR